MLLHGETHSQLQPLMQALKYPLPHPHTHTYTQLSAAHTETDFSGVRSNGVISAALLKGTACLPDVDDDGDGDFIDSGCHSMRTVWEGEEWDGCDSFTAFCYFPGN